MENWKNEKCCGNIAAVSAFEPRASVPQPFNRPASPHTFLRLFFDIYWSQYLSRFEQLFCSLKNAVALTFVDGRVKQEKIDDYR